jgi:hypothetical protein
VLVAELLFMGSQVHWAVEQALHREAAWMDGFSQLVAVLVLTAVSVTLRVVAVSRDLPGAGPRHVEAPHC